MNIDRRNFLRMVGRSIVYTLSPSLYFPEGLDPYGEKIKYVRSFLTDKDRLKHFSTLQLDPLEYPGLDESRAKAVGQNSCGSSTIATSYNLMEHLWGNPWNSIKIGQVRDILLNDLGNSYFDDESKTKRGFIQPGGLMHFYDLTKAYPKFGFKTVDVFGDNYSAVNYPILITYNNVEELADKIKRDVFNVGGFLLGYSIRYDGHFILITDFNPVKHDSGKVIDLELFIIDGRGTDGKGTIGKVRTSEYSPYYEMIGGRKIWTTGFRGLLGIVPTI